MPPEPVACDLLLQNCPDGQKCTYTWDEDLIPGARCVPEVDSPAGPGASCQAFGDVFSGLDTCARGAMCWELHADLSGRCVAFCSEVGDSCAPLGSCYLLADDGIAAHICLRNCDPLVQDCPAGELCVESTYGGVEPFVCAPDWSGDEGHLFGACTPWYFCDPGLVCTWSAAASECLGLDQCCLPFCELGTATCPGEGQQCLPFFEEGNPFFPPPPKWDHVGLCKRPP